MPLVSQPKQKNIIPENCSIDKSISLGYAWLATIQGHLFTFYLFLASNDILRFFLREWLTVDVGCTNTQIYKSFQLF